ncbi:hypothetical protein GCM10022402_09400 [Salinactinospora qingdaonensis]|uniref:Uncharacterized protein n=1 Tax=Salinactinospora qingdaonensis TaxID=702744 RepID=A0ABP7F5S3_9ACTN
MAEQPVDDGARVLDGRAHAGQLRDPLERVGGCGRCGIHAYEPYAWNPRCHDAGAQLSYL